ncbi:hypothetical protein [Actinomadura roseirufa]|uniref:hypothetical protein n=1 Tax=Actinomadura roseirufa TaxID=2094049 RepID=UPI0010416B94|nr:hypothetical protein [Actinomadura roseirufa]
MTTLENLYRRLLAWYPADHRAAHEEEMLDVLLSAAKPGQKQPSVIDTLDLLYGAVRIRLRRAVGGTSGSVWPEALSIAGFLAMLMLVADGVRFAVNSPQIVTHFLPVQREGGEPFFDRLSFYFGTAPYWLAWVVIAVLAWCGARRAAARAACAVTAVQFALVIYGVGFPEIGIGWIGASLGGVPLPLALVASASLVASPGPGHGARSLGRRGVAGAVVSAAVLIAVTSTPLFTLINQEHLGEVWYSELSGGSFLRWDRTQLAGVLLTALFLAGLLARTPQGRRAAALFMLGGAPLIVQVGRFSMGTPAEYPELSYLLVQSLIGFALVMLVVRFIEHSLKTQARGRDKTPA